MKYFLSMLCLAIGITVNVNAQTSSGYAVGDKVADFSLKNVDGKDVALSQYPSSKGFIIVFTCNTCPYAKAYQDRVAALNAQYAVQGFPVIAINTNDPEAEPGDSYVEMQKRAKEKSFAFPYLYDPGQLVTRQYGATRTPQVFVLSKAGGSNAIAYIGAIDNDTENKNPDKKNYVQDAVNALLAGRKPELAFTKAVGCTVKSKKL